MKKKIQYVGKMSLSRTTEITKQQINTKKLFAFRESPSVKVQQKLPYNYHVSDCHSHNDHEGRGCLSENI